MSGSVFTTIIIAFFLIVAFAVLAFAVLKLVRAIKRILSCEQPKNIVYLLAFIGCVFLVAASWIFNMGWLRVILIWVPVPIVHLAIMLALVCKACEVIHLSQRLKKYTLLSLVTYCAAYLLLPDFGDVGGAYMLFGLIRGDSVATVAFVFAALSAVVNICMLIFMNDETKKLKQAK